MSNKPVDVLVRDAQGRSLPFSLHTGDVVALLRELTALGTVLATEKRDIETIRAHYSIEMQRLANTREEVLRTLDHDYNERTLQIKGLQEQIMGFGAMGQIEIVKLCMQALKELGPSPLRQIIDSRNARLKNESP